jgi:hypothetical protein
MNQYHLDSHHSSAPTRAQAEAQRKLQPQLLRQQQELHSKLLERLLALKISKLLVPRPVEAL